MSALKPPSITVSSALYNAHGTPHVFGALLPTPHRCGSCFTNTDCFPAKQVLSHNFSTWEDIAADGGNRWLCEPCAWIYKTRPGLNTPLLITAEPSTQRPTPGLLRTTLDRPIPADTAIVIPLNGKRTITPLARWGLLTTDAGTRPWTSKDARMMHAATELRSTHGVLERSMPSPSPPEAVFASTPPETHSRIRELWKVLEPARAESTLIALMMHLSRKDPTP